MALSSLRALKAVNMIGFNAFIDDQVINMMSFPLLFELFEIILHMGM